MSTMPGSRSVTSLRLRVKRRTRPPARWACTRAPSSFHSTEAVPIAASAASTSADGLANIGNTGRFGSNAERVERLASLGEGDGRRGEQVTRHHRRAPHRRDRHVSGARDRRRHHTVERALAQLAAEHADQEPLLAFGGAGEDRPAGDRDAPVPSPGRRARPAAASASLTSRTVSVADGAGSTRAFDIVAQPTPIRPSGNDPIRNATAGATSAGSRRRSMAASAATFSLRLVVDATTSEAPARSSKSVGIPTQFSRAATTDTPHERYVGRRRAPATVPGRQDARRGTSVRNPGGYRQ